MTIIGNPFAVTIGSRPATRPFLSYHQKWSHTVARYSGLLWSIRDWAHGATLSVLGLVFRPHTAHLLSHACSSSRAATSLPPLLFPLPPPSTAAVRFIPACHRPCRYRGKERRRPNEEMPHTQKKVIATIDLERAAKSGRCAMMVAAARTLR